MQTASKTTIQLGDIEVRFLVEPGDSDGAATVFECDVAADAKVPAPHSHDGFDETVYGLAGVMTFTVDGDTREVGAGESICIRRGQVHEFVNRSGADATFLSVATPGLFGPRYFEEIREVLVAAAGGPPDIGALVGVMRARTGSRPLSRARAQASTGR